MALSYYSVIQYVPDPIADERVNVGLVVVSPELRYARAFLDDPRRRARRLRGSADVSFLHRLERDLASQQTTDQLLGLWTPDQALTSERLRRLHEEAGNVVQYTEPRAASVSDPEQLVVRLQRRYLRPIARRTRARSSAAVRGAVQRALRTVGLGSAARVDVPIEGAHDTYMFDFVVTGRSARRIVEVKSLELGEDVVRSDLHATGYRLWDIRTAGTNDPFTLVVAASHAPSALLDLAHGIMRDLHGEVIPEHHAPTWADRVATELLSVPA